jgi:hypothetical protein
VCALLLGGLPRTLYAHSCKFRASTSYSFDNNDTKCMQWCKQLDAQAKAKGKKGCCESHSKKASLQDQKTTKTLDFYAKKIANPIDFGSSIVGFQSNFLRIYDVKKYIVKNTEFYRKNKIFVLSGRSVLILYGNFMI